jgi:prepilin-type processing-associated H-X9-DG protein
VSVQANAPGGSYSYNAHGVGLSREGDPPVCFGLGETFDPRGGDWSRIPPVSEDRIIAPSDMYALGDAQIEYWNDLRWTMGELSFVGGIEEKLVQMSHRNIHNMLFVDGHVESVKKPDLTKPEPAFGRRWSNTDLDYMDGPPGK